MAAGHGQLGGAEGQAQAAGGDAGTGSVGQENAWNQSWDNWGQGYDQQAAYGGEQGNQWYQPAQNDGQGKGITS